MIVFAREFQASLLRAPPSERRPGCAASAPVQISSLCCTRRIKRKWPLPTRSSFSSTHWPCSSGRGGSWQSLDRCSLWTFAQVAPCPVRLLLVDQLNVTSSGKPSLVLSIEVRHLCSGVLLSLPRSALPLLWLSLKLHPRFRAFVTRRSAPPGPRLYFVYCFVPCAGHMGWHRGGAGQHLWRVNNQKNVPPPGVDPSA